MPAAAAQNVLDDILGPFRGFDLAATYARYSGLVDFVIYALLFTALAHLTIGKRFQGRGGKALTVAVALIMTISLLAVERTMGFNIASFGPLAAGVVVILVAMTLYFGFRQLGASHVASASAALIAIYFSTRAVTPQLFQWLADKVPFIHAVLAIALLVAVWRLGAAAWPSGGKAAAETAARGLAGVKEAAREVFPTAEMRKERGLIKARLEPFTRQGRREHKAMASDLKEMQSIVTKHQDSPYAVSLMAKKIKDIRPKQHDLEVRLANLQALTKQFLRLDESVVARIKGKDFSKLSRKEQGLVRNIWLEEKAKINAERNLQVLESEAKKHLEGFGRAINMASASLRAGKPNECQMWLNGALKTEAAAGRLLKRMEKLEKELRMWTELQEKMAARASS